MNKFCLLVIILLTFQICNAQNLVPNGDFEEHVGCPDNYSQIDSSLFWFNPCLPPYGSFSGQSGSCDYYNSCAPIGQVGVPNNVNGYQPSHSGIAYAGLYTYWGYNSNFREYLEVQLITPLIANECYYFEMFINLANLSHYAADTISAYFSDTAVSGLHSHSPFLFNSQIKNQSGIISDTLNWTKVSGTFTASGGESYLIIGNQNDDVHTDTLSVSTSFYRFSYVYIDDVFLTPCSGAGIKEQTANTQISFYPNPFTDNLSVVTKNNELSELILYDITSRIILRKQFVNSVLVNTEQLAKGVYLFEIKNKTKTVKMGKVVKD